MYKASNLNITLPLFPVEECASAYAEVSSSKLKVYTKKISGQATTYAPRWALWTLLCWQKSKFPLTAMR